MNAPVDHDFTIREIRVNSGVTFCRKIDFVVENFH
jgi:hypothetical protein